MEFDATDNVSQPVPGTFARSDRIGSLGTSDFEWERVLFHVPGITLLLSNLVADTPSL